MLTDAFAACPLVSKEVHHYKHAPASKVEAITGCYGARKIAIYRDDREIAESFYRMVRGYETTKWRGLVTDEWDREAQRLASMSFEEFLREPIVPKMSQFVDTDDVDVVTWQQAYQISCATFDFYPEVPVARFA